MEYREFGSERIDEIVEIYRANGWTSYLGDRDRLFRAFDSSLYVLGAFEDGNLVGFVRCVGDGEFILYVQDLIVLPSHTRRGIGRELMRRVSERYPDVRQFLLITDEADETANAFYRAIGMTQDLGGFSVNPYFRTLNKNKADAKEI